ncbi:MAG TPA: LytTR family DNA-binding domain-containing protein [Thermoanaerobaculia bacterium]
MERGDVTTPLRALVIDDEPLAREALRLMIDRHDDFKVVGECSGVDAPALITKTKPDVLFLDIQMPELDGFGVIEAVGVDAVPAVVFVTAYDAYALKAFDVHALDYLLKPFDDVRLTQTLERVKSQLRGGNNSSTTDRLVALLEDRERAATYARRFLVRVHEKVVVVRAEDIDWIEAADYYASIHAGPASYLLRETMAELERRLDPERFFRVHRSAIVNLDRIREVHPLFRGDCTLVLSNGTQVRLSRTRREEFARLFAAP